MSPATGEERVAVLLKNLPGELVDSVLGQMDPDHAGRLRQRMQVAPAADSPEARQVLSGFIERLRRVSAEAASPADIPKDEFVPSALARAILTAVDSDPVSPSQILSAQTSANAVDPTLKEDAVQLLRELGTARMAAALRGERTPTIVLALSCLPGNEAGEVLKRLPTERRREATMRLARNISVNQELLQAVARAVVQKGRSLGEDLEELDGDGLARKLASVLRELEREDRKEVLEGLAIDEPEIAEKVKNLLYVFEDLLRIEDRSVQALLAEVEIKTLSVALSGVEEALMTKVKKNLSQRAQDTLAEEMGLLGKLRASQVKEARNQVVTVIQRLDAEGKLVMME